MGHTLTFTDFVEYILVRLYDLDRGELEYVDVKELAAELQDSVPSSWPFEAVQVLEDRGYVHAAMAMASAQAFINGAGRMYVEAREREANSLVREFREHPQNIVSVSGSGHQVSVGNLGPVTQVSLTAKAREELLSLLCEVEETIRSTESVSDDERSEYLADIATARTQLEKKEPNRAAVAAVLNPLAKVAAIAGPVLTILKMLGVG